MIDQVEPRSHYQMIADLLQLAIDGEWSADSNHYCGDYGSCCPECDVRHYEHADHRCERPNQHLPNCSRMLLIKETRAYLRVENELALVRGEEGFYFNDG